MKERAAVKLDKTDYKILAELDFNSRLQSLKIAKKLRLSRNIVDYRIKQLQEKRVILAFNAFIDPAKFNLISWKVYLRFQNLAPQKEKEILDYLNNHRRVWWIIRCAGAFDLMFCVLAESIHDFYQEMLEFNTLFSNYVIETELTSHIDPEFYTRGYLGKESMAPSKPFLVKPSRMDFDQLDIRLLDFLGQNCRLPVTEIARKLGSTPRVIAYKMSRLEREGVITWYRIIMEPSKLGREYYKTLINFKGITREKELEFLGFCRSHPDIINISKAAGPWDMELECEVESYHKYNELMQMVRSTFPELIKQYSTLLIYEQLKFENNFLRYGRGTASVKSIR
ncbi:MAG: winged helix-turn-helix transcriptional regulator [Candidatus ainarchaeum sp.]|nr:winged helix-turn-helix transcriptional regulator [Candidatus ainarchaeum sp.]